MDKHSIGNWAPTDAEPSKSIFATLSSKKYISGYLYLQHHQSHYHANPVTGSIDLNRNSNAGVGATSAFKIEKAKSVQPNPETIMLTAESCGMVSMVRAWQLLWAFDKRSEFDEVPDLDHLE